MKDLTDITIILDRSGSMSIVREDTIGGFNTFLDEQKKIEGDARISLYQFNHEFSTIYENKKLHEASNIGTKTYTPGGMTALLDAIGKVINKKGQYYKNLSEDERPDKILITIMTDGQENSSKEFTKDKIKEMIEHQKNAYKWQFAFIGAAIDAFTDGGGLSINRGSTMKIKNLNDFNQGFVATSKATARFRAMGGQFAFEEGDSSDDSKVEYSTTASSKKAKSQTTSD